MANEEANNKNVPNSDNKTENEESTVKMPEEMAMKFYQATGRIPKEGDEDYENWREYPQVVASHLDKIIADNQAKMDAEEKAAADQVAIDEFEKRSQSAATDDYISDGKYSLLSFQDNPLVKFQSDPTPEDNIDDTNTIWLFDSEKKTYRPFASVDAMKAYFGDNYEEAIKNINHLPTTALQNEKWKAPNENFFDRQYAIQNDGNVPENPKFFSVGEVATYGKPREDSKSEEEWAGKINDFFTDVKGRGGISEKTFEKYLNSESGVMANYTSAAMYGGYKFSDLYRDLKAKELYDDGNERYKDVKGFDDEMSASEWYETQEYLAVKNDLFLTGPMDMLGFSDELINNPITKIPDDAFKEIVPILDKGSDKFKEEAEAIQASYYDIMMQKAEATTEQEKALADNNWDLMREYIDKKYGLQLSNNAGQAWGQLQNMFNQGSQAGIADSGIVDETMDKYLQDVRKSDDLIREDEMTSRELETRSFLFKNGSKDEIADFVASNPNKAKRWGLIPSDEIKEWYSEENLRSLYPDMNDEQISQISGMVLDENGNYRSQMYQNLYANKYDLGEQKISYQQNKLYQQKLADEKEAYAPFSMSNPLSSYQVEVPEDEETNNNNNNNSTSRDYWSEFKKKYSNRDWSDYERIAEGEAGNYEDIQNPSDKFGGGGTKLYGRKPIDVSDIKMTSLGEDGSKDRVANKVSYWDKFKKEHNKRDWSSYEAIEDQDTMNKFYTDIQNPGGHTLYGIRRK